MLHPDTRRWLAAHFVDLDAVHGCIAIVRLGVRLYMETASKRTIRIEADLKGDEITIVSPRTASAAIMWIDLHCDREYDRLQRRTQKYVAMTDLVERLTVQAWQELGGYAYLRDAMQSFAPRMFP